MSKGCSFIDSLIVGSCSMSTSKFVLSFMEMGLSVTYEVRKSLSEKMLSLIGQISVFLKPAIILIGVVANGKTVFIVPGMSYIENVLPGLFTIQLSIAELVYFFSGP